MTPELPALLGTGRTWRSAMARARKPSASHSAVLPSPESGLGSLGFRATGIKSPRAMTRGGSRLRVSQAVGTGSGGLPAAERSDAKKQTNLHRSGDKLGRMYTFGERLRWAMAQTHPPTSGRALAQRVGMRPQSIGYLCDPNRNAKGSKHTLSIARALGVSPEWLATGAGAPYPGGEPSLDQRAAVAACIRSTEQLLADLQRLAQVLGDAPPDKQQRS